MHTDNDIIGETIHDIVVVLVCHPYHVQVCASRAPGPVPHHAWDYIATCVGGLLQSLWIHA